MPQLDNLQLSGKTTFIFGKRGTGKTKLVVNLLNLCPPETKKIIISPSERLRPFYSTFFADAEIHYELGNSLIDDILQRLDNQEIIVVMDDCLFPAQEKVRKLTNGKGTGKLTSIIVSQCPLFDFKPNNVFCLADHSEEMVETRWRQYFSDIYPDIVAFKEAHEKATQNFGFLYRSF